MNTPQTEAPAPQGSSPCTLGNFHTATRQRTVQQQKRCIQTPFRVAKQAYTSPCHQCLKCSSSQLSLKTVYCSPPLSTISYGNQRLGHRPPKRTYIPDDQEIASPHSKKVKQVHTIGSDSINAKKRESKLYTPPESPPSPAAEILTTRTELSLISRAEIDQTSVQKPPLEPQIELARDSWIPQYSLASTVSAEQRWSKTYHGFDYWIFYRIEALKRRLKETAMRRKYLQGHVYYAVATTSSAATPNQGYSLQGRIS